MTEDIVEMGIKPQKKKAKVTMTVDEYEDLKRRLEALENKEHHCDCPNRIIDMGQELKRLDVLDDNDELLRQNINRLANMVTDGFDDLEKKNQASIADTNGRLEEEHRLRADTESELKAMKQESKELSDELNKANEVIARYKKDVNWLTVLTGAVLGVGLVVIALSIAGLL